MLEAIAIIVTGGLAGWIAARLVRGAGYGLVVNVIVGIIGGVIGAKLFALLEIPVGSWFVELAMAVLGAVLLLGLVNLLRPRPNDARKRVTAGRSAAVERGGIARRLVEVPGAAADAIELPLQQRDRIGIGLAGLERAQVLLRRPEIAASARCPGRSAAPTARTAGRPGRARLVAGCDRSRAGRRCSTGGLSSRSRSVSMLRASGDRLCCAVPAAGSATSERKDDEQQRPGHGDLRLPF